MAEDQMFIVLRNTEIMPRFARHFRKGTLSFRALIGTPGGTRLHAICPGPVRLNDEGYKIIEE